MDAYGILQIVVYTAVIIALTPLIGGYMARVYSGQPVLLGRVIGPFERGIYRLCGIRADHEQHWTAYAFSILAFSIVGVLSAYLIMRLQAFLPLNPAAMANVAPDLAFNTAVSFNTNTNWQNYGGESTMSYFTQMTVLTVHNFLSAGIGIAVAVAFIRAFSRRTAKSIGNFHVDLTRTVLYVLLPICVVGALVLVWQGVPQNLSAYTEATTVEGAKQVIAQGPVASQMMIKHLGTNGGGFFNANAAHPFENPTPLANMITMLSIFIIGTGLVYTFGKMVGDVRQGWAILGAMGVLFLLGVGICYWAEAQGNPALTALGIDQAASHLQAGGNMEGKEVRFGIASSTLFATITTDTSCGAVNSMHESYMPLGGMVPLVNILLGEVVVGGVGSGLYGILLYVLISVFIAGLMVGRTPEYLGKKVEAKEVKLAVIGLLAMTFSILGFSALSIALPAGLAGLSAAGPHGLSEMLYAFASTTGNNGSAFAGLSGNTVYYNSVLAAAMLVGRFFMMLPVLGIAGAVAAKKTVPPSAGTFPTHGPLFVTLLVAVIVVVTGLTYFPVLALGPIVEHLMLGGGTLF